MNQRAAGFVLWHQQNEDAGDAVAGLTWSADSRRVAWVELLGYVNADYDRLVIATVPDAH